MPRCPVSRISSAARQKVTETITIISTDKTLTKKIYLDEDGDIQKTAYDNAYLYDHTEQEIENLIELSEVLMILESIYYACVIRGELIDQDGQQNNITRTKINVPSKGQKAYYREKAEGRCWVCFDFDKVPNFCKLEEPEEFLSFLVQMLGKEFKDVSYHYQFSSSAGLDDWDTISCHLWYWLSEPRTDAEMERWALKNGEVDEAIFRTVQPHYTATPIFDGVQDPIGVKRSGLVLKQFDSVLLDVIPPNPHITPYLKTDGSSASNVSYVRSRSFSQHLNDIGPRYHTPIRNFIASCVRRLGTVLDEQALKEVIRQRIAAAPEGASPKNGYTADKYLDASIRGAVEKYGGHTPTNRELRKMKIDNKGSSYVIPVRDGSTT
jgi:hypothetical protein